MKLLILSDSHGVISTMKRAVLRSVPDQIIHLGDCWQDGQRLHQLFPQIPFYQVPGNCDHRPEDPSERLLRLEGYRILICHGNTYGVKQSLISAGLAAEEKNLDLFLFGHTHHPLVDRRGKTLFLNPGSIGDAAHPFYGEVLLDSEHLDGKIVELPRE